MALPYKSIVVDPELISDFRIYSGDLPEYNRLMEGTESSDEKLKLAFQLWLHSFTNTPPIIKEFKYEDFNNFNIVFEGVMIQTLTMNGIVNTRNFLNFNDGGVSFTVADKGQAYMQWINMFMQKHRQDVEDLKVALNLESAYDYIPSPESWNYPYDVY